jgi:hypothetical protein
VGEAFGTVPAPGRFCLAFFVRLSPLALMRKALTGIELGEMANAFLGVANIEGRANRWSRAYSAGRRTSIDALLSDIDRALAVKS